jgi:putative flavoprotein involved in K+ transport
MQLYGRADGYEAGVLLVREGLTRHPDSADAVSESIKRSIDGFIAKSSIGAPEEAPYQPASPPAAERES